MVFFYHDSDANWRETAISFTDKQSGKEARLNFEQENRIQKKFSPFYAKRIPQDWQKKLSRILPQYAPQNAGKLFTSIKTQNIADFCLEMYKHLGLLENITIIRSGNKEFRETAIELEGEFYADVPYQNEIVRAKYQNQRLFLHEGGEKYIYLPAPEKFEKAQKSAGRDQRFAWMQSAVNCTHYIYGEGEANYLEFKNFPEVEFVPRLKTDKPEFAWLENL